MKEPSISSTNHTRNSLSPPTPQDSASACHVRTRRIASSVSSPDLKEKASVDSISNDLTRLSVASSAGSLSPSMFNYHEYLVDYYNARANGVANLDEEKDPKMASRVNRSKLRLYSKLPWRKMSRAWGKINSMNLPVWCRKPCFNLYSKMFKCNLNEMENPDLKQYKNLSEFFRRGLKPDSRVVDKFSCLISPCDGKILHFGKVSQGYLEQVKGVNYSLRAFLGKQNWPKNAPSSPRTILDNKCESVSNMQSAYDQINDEHHRYEQSILYHSSHKLYHCVIYLAPGDYHRFHSPTDWTVLYRRHFPGELFSVNPSVARWLQGLFNMNERVVYYGHWKYGFFSMAPVGATNVGSIRVYMDEKLTTNNKAVNKKSMSQSFDQTFCTASKPDGQHLQRGEDFGEFNLGSTIVLIFEAPDNFQFDIKQNEKVFFGQRLGSASRSAYL